jgi:hypothetical protein
MDEQTKKEYQAGIDTLPDNIKSILNEKLTIEDIQALHSYTIHKQNEFKNQTRIELQTELNDLISRITGAGLFLDGVKVVTKEPEVASQSQTQALTSTDDKWARTPSEAYIQKARNTESNWFAAQYLFDGQFEKLPPFKAFKALCKSANQSAISYPNLQACYAIMNDNAPDPRVIGRNYDSASPATVWLFCEFKRLLENGVSSFEDSLNSELSIS